MSLATDLGMGQPLESGLAVCRVAVALAEEAGLDQAERDRVYYVALLRHVGCTAETHTFSSVVGDDLTFHAEAFLVDATSPRVLAAFTLRHLIRTNGLVGTAAKLAHMVAIRDRAQEGPLAVCEVAMQLAAQLQLSEAVQTDLFLFPERWDGKSFSRRARDEEVPAPVRIVQIAECASVFNALEGIDTAVSVVRSRAGSAFDPSYVEVFARHAPALLAAEGELWEHVIGDAPETDRTLAGDQLTDALIAVAGFTDLKSPYTVGHSSGVARLADAAADQAGLSPSDRELLFQCGLVHDIGRVGVASPIWEKPGPLTSDEREKVRLHAYYGERILARSPSLARLGAIASLHHERCDGSGYHRSVDARALPLPARILAAADAYHAMTEARPHRPALEPAAAAAELRQEVRAGRMDSAAVDAVLAAAAGTPPRRRRKELVAGLTTRELEVLRLVARGLSTKGIAQALVISPKTADTHIQHVYAKIGVSTRAAATVFAMRHDLVDPGESSGELPR